MNEVRLFACNWNWNVCKLNKQLLCALSCDPKFSPFIHGIAQRIVTSDMPYDSWQMYKYAQIRKCYNEKPLEMKKEKKNCEMQQNTLWENARAKVYGNSWNFLL